MSRAPARREARQRLERLGTRPSVSGVRCLTIANFISPPPRQTGRDGSADIRQAPQQMDSPGGDGFIAMQPERAYVGQHSLNHAAGASAHSSSPGPNLRKEPVCAGRIVIRKIRARTRKHPDLPSASLHGVCCLWAGGLQSSPDWPDATAALQYDHGHATSLSTLLHRTHIETGQVDDPLEVSQLP